MNLIQIYNHTHTAHTHTHNHTVGFSYVAILNNNQFVPVLWQSCCFFFWVDNARAHNIYHRKVLFFSVPPPPPTKKKENQYCEMDSIAGWPILAFKPLMWPWVQLHRVRFIILTWAARLKWSGNYTKHNLSLFLEKQKNLISNSRDEVTFTTLDWSWHCKTEPYGSALK